MPLLSARGLSVAPPGARDCVVRDFDLDLHAGEWVAITGGNGSGKTTLALALAGLWPIAGGALLLMDEPFGPHGAPSRRASVAALLQDPASQLLQASLDDELSFGARNLGRAEPEVAAAVSRWSARLGLVARPGADPRTLSAGGQQLALFVSAMIQAPRLLVADEPAAHLDRRARAAILHATREEVGRGLAVAWVTQDPAEIAAADRCLSLSEAGEERWAAAGAMAAEGEIVCRLRVGLPGTDSGPVVRVAGPTEVALYGRGVTALVGPNGGGKSVLLGAASGMLALDQVSVERSDGPGAPPILAAQYPEHQLFEERVADELVWAAVSRGLSRAEAAGRARACLVELGMDPETILPRRAWDLSGGEKRIVAVISALIAPASLLALDEPTAGLDRRRRAALAGLVRRRAELGPVLIASQDAGWIERLAARVVCVGD